MEFHDLTERAPVLVPSIVCVTLLARLAIVPPQRKVVRAVAFALTSPPSAGSLSSTRLAQHDPVFVADADADVAWLSSYLVGIPSFILCGEWAFSGQWVHQS